MPRTPLENFPQEVFKTFKNFTQLDFGVWFYFVQILGVAIFRVANSSCYKPNPVKRDWVGIENSPCVSSRRGCLYRIPKNSVIYSRIFVVI